MKIKKIIFADGWVHDFDCSNITLLGQKSIKMQNPDFYKTSFNPENPEFLPRFGQIMTYHLRELFKNLCQICAAEPDPAESAVELLNNYRLESVTFAKNFRSEKYNRNEKFVPL